MIPDDVLNGDAAAIAAAVASNRIGAGAIARHRLRRIAAANPALTAFTEILETRALADADRVDRLVAAGADPGPLAGVPFAVKDLFDVAGHTTTAGAASRQAALPAISDAAAVARLREAGAVLVGTTNMDEFAYGFSTENAHFGTTGNPHDPARIAGGSSGGSAAAVAAGLVPLSLGSDTNGSIRVPASLCGIYGLRPSMDAVPVEGAFPFVESLDVVGPFARSLDTLQAAFEVLAVRRLAHPAQVRVAALSGWFGRNSDPDALAAVRAVSAFFGGAEPAQFPLAEAARSAAFLITAAEGGRRHLAALRADPLAFDPAVRDRLIAGLAVSPELVAQAETVRERVRSRLPEIFAHSDVLVAPATPCTAPAIGGGTIEIDGRQVSARANLGIFTQPLSLVGLPVLSVPIRRAGRLPLGLQLIAAPGGEAALFAVARLLEQAGITGFTPPEANPC